MVFELKTLFDNSTRLLSLQTLFLDIVTIGL